MEIILICALALLVIYVFGYSNIKKSKSPNSYDAFIVSGIGQTNAENSLFNTRKLPKSSEKNTEFYITSKIASAILKEQQELNEQSADPDKDSNKKVRVSPHSNDLLNKAQIKEKPKKDVEEKQPEDSFAEKKDYLDVHEQQPKDKNENENENDENSDSDNAKRQQKSHLYMENGDEDIDELVNEILRPHEKKIGRESTSTLEVSEVDENFTQVLQQKSKWKEDIQRKKTDSNDPFFKRNDKDTTRRYQRSQLEPSTEFDNEETHHLHNDIFSGINDILEEVNQMKKDYRALKGNHSENKGENENGVATSEKPSYRDDFLAYKERSKESLPEKEELTSLLFVKKAQEIVDKYHVPEDLLGDSKPMPKVEKVLSRKKNYDRSEVINEWHKKLGFWE